MNIMPALKITCLTTLLISLQPCAAQESKQVATNVKICTSEEQLTELTKTGNVVVVSFDDPWCPPCRMLVHMFRRIATDWASVTFVEARIRTAHSPMPIIIFYKDGQEITRKTGMVREAELRELIKTTFAL